MGDTPEFNDEALVPPKAATATQMAAPAVDIPPPFQMPQHHPWGPFAGYLSALNAAEDQRAMQAYQMNLGRAEIQQREQHTTVQQALALAEFAATHSNMASQYDLNASEMTNHALQLKAQWLQEAQAIQKDLQYADTPEAKSQVMNRQRVNDMTLQQIANMQEAITTIHNRANMEREMGASASTLGGQLAGQHFANQMFSPQGQPQGDTSAPGGSAPAAAPAKQDGVAPTVAPEGAPQGQASPQQAAPTTPSAALVGQQPAPAEDQNAVATRAAVGTPPGAEWDMQGNTLTVGTPEEQKALQQQIDKATGGRSKTIVQTVVGKRSAETMKAIEPTEQMNSELQKANLTGMRLEPGPDGALSFVGGQPSLAADGKHIIPGQPSLTKTAMDGTPVPLEPREAAQALTAVADTARTTPAIVKTAASLYPPVHQWLDQQVAAGNVTKYGEQYTVNLFGPESANMAMIEHSLHQLGALAKNPTLRGALTLPTPEIAARQFAKEIAQTPVGAGLAAVNPGYVNLREGTASGVPAELQPVVVSAKLEKLATYLKDFNPGKRLDDQTSQRVVSALTAPIPQGNRLLDKINPLVPNLRLLASDPKSFALLLSALSPSSAAYLADSTRSIMQPSKKAMPTKG